MTRERFLRSSDGTSLFVTSTDGEGVPLVLCDGLGCDGFIWKKLVPAFVGRHPMIHMHYRGHGKSGIPADLESLTVPNLVRDLAHVLDVLGAGPVVLLGHSMGCQVVLDFALTHRERVAGIIPICGSAGRPLETFHNSALLATVMPHLRQMADRWPSLAQTAWAVALRSELSYQYASHVEVNGALVSRADFWPYFEHLLSMDVRVFTAMATHANAHSVEDRLRNIACPTLIVAGERDAFTPFWVSQQVRQTIPDAELLVVPGGTHIAPLEIPELVHLRVARFLAERVQAQWGNTSTVVSPKRGAHPPAAALVS